MSLVWNWFWADKKKAPASVHDSLFREMRQVFDAKEITAKAERKYDYDKVFDTLCHDLDVVNDLYEALGDNFPSAADKARLGEAIGHYFDDVVKHKEFIFDNPILKMAVARRLLQHADREGFVFDWHYWQLFRRDLHRDTLAPTIALDIIENGEPDSSSSEDDEWSDSE